MIFRNRLRRAALLATCLLALRPAAFTQTAEPPRYTPQVEYYVKNFKPGGHDLTGQVVPLSPEESLKRLHPAPGYDVELAASEPVVRQPIDLRFDDRGRLWVVQYLQYPYPAGLTVTGYDQYLRAEFDRVSPPPPRHFRGADKITILEDQDGDGNYETHKTFLDGLNMATSIALAPDGVWVLQPPYLLFYADRNGDDVPDGDPEVHLAGFGLEDTHALASSLHWGPDGWLYGAQGSTSTLQIQGVHLLGQGIWRYHPGTRQFELFAEGGGNTFSFEFDRYGRAYSGTNNGATRGLHYVQGGTYIKGWTKHGPAVNPFVFGFFEHMAHEGYSQRFPQSFLFYEGGLLSQLNGQIVVGMALTNRVQASQVFADTSTFRTVDSVALITSDDRAFRPVDVEDGPDGCIYLADWYDVRLSHPNPQDNWDKTNGRIFRLTPKAFVRPATVDLRKTPTPELITMLASSNRWQREHARQLLAVRPEMIAPALKALLENNQGGALEGLWVLHLRGELDEACARATLRHPNEHVRRWAVRLLGDRNSVGPETQVALADLARREAVSEVRSQLASTAKRLPAGQAFPIIRQLLTHDEDAADKHLPLLIWWALEAKAETGREEIVALVKEAAVWKTKLFRQHLATRIARRYTADQGPNKYWTLKQGVYSEWQIERAPEYLRRNLELCARLLSVAPDPAAADLLITGMAEGLSGAPVAAIPRALAEIITRLWASRPHTASLTALAARLGQSGAMAEAIALVKSGQLNRADQEQLIELFRATGSPDALPLIAELLRADKNEQRRRALLEALGGYSQAAAAQIILDLYPTLGPRLQIVAQRMLSEKPAWALAMLERMAAGAFQPGVLSSANIAAINAHKNAQIDSLFSKYQQSRTDDPAERLAQRLYEQGRATFGLNCAACHGENGQGHPGMAPSLVSSPWVQAGEIPMARIVLHGKEKPGRGLVMPSLKHMDDGQIAAAITYVRREFGNQPGMVTPARVAEVRAATADRATAWTDEELARLPR